MFLQSDAAVTIWGKGGGGLGSWWVAMTAE